MVTGASTGIGKSIAMSLDSVKYTVYAGVRSSASADALTAERPSLRPIVLDVTDSASCEAAAAEVARAVADEGLALVGLVNNAGISHRVPFEMETLEAVREMYAVNVLGVYAATLPFLPLLRNSSGRVVNVGSLAALFATPGSGTYSGTKAALELTTDAMRLELRPANISVSLIQPGYVKSEIASKQTGARAAWHRKEVAARALAQYGDADALHALYADWIGKQDERRLKMEELAAPTLVVSAAALHALLAPKPRTRYVVGTVGKHPAWVFPWLAWILPDRLQDWIIGMLFS